MTDIVDRIKDAETATNALFDHVIQHAREEIERLRTENAGLVDDMNLLRDNNTALRAHVEAMERQEPVAWLHESRRDSDVVTSAVKQTWQRARPMSLASYTIPLYLAPGAQPTPSISPVALRHVIQWLRPDEGSR